MASAIARNIIPHFNKKRKNMSKKLMNVVANEISYTTPLRLISLLLVYLNTTSLLFQIPFEIH